MKLCLTPSPATAPTDNGIGRVLHAMGKYLPRFGIQFTEDPNNADVVAFHAGTALGTRVDVLHCHGLYWNDLEHKQFSRTHNVANQRIVEAARRAKIITVPSDWVAEPFRRDMRIEPTVIGHGIDIDEWEVGDASGGYILWNKCRTSDVCDPVPAWRLAERGLRVVSTYGPPGKILQALNVTGTVPFERMKQIIHYAKFYLSTAPETFGIGTLEAMACGVPVLGYDWCGTKDIVQHKVTGWLAAVGDIDGLMEGAEWLSSHRAEISANARSEAEHYDWPSIISKYYDVYTSVMKPEPVGVSIVISNHNYGRYISDAIRSCLWQSTPPDEVIVVDDGSTDNSLEVLKPYAALGKIKLIEQSNQGVAAARNNGIRSSSFPFIVNLDADDMLGPDFIRTLRPALERDRGMGVAYTGVKFINEDAHDTGHSAHRIFSWEIQAKDEVPPPTCIPSGSMFRKAMWERCGGFKQKYAPGEDTEFWTHGLSLGFTAEMVTHENMFWYRGHVGSASRTRQYVSIGDNKPWLKDKIYPIGAPSYYVPEVRSYWNPLISVIIPVGPGHEAIIEDAIESVIGQNVRDWELIVVNDTGSNELAWIRKRYPFIKYEMTAGMVGAGAARNEGIVKARGSLVLFLDADDYLRWDALDLMLQAYVRTGHYVFTDFYAIHKDGSKTREKVFDYDREFYRTKQVMHSVTALIPREWVWDVNGFDPSLIGYEEYDFYMKLAVKGYCGVCLREPLFYYRLASGKRRLVSAENKDQLNSIFSSRFAEAEMAGCCGTAGNSIMEAKRALGIIPRETLVVAELPNEVRLEFTGPYLGPVGFTVNGRIYYGAKDDIHRFVNAPREDVAGLLATNKWRVVAPPAGDSAPTVETNPQPEFTSRPLTNFRRG